MQVIDGNQLCLGPAGESQYVEQLAKDPLRVDRVAVADGSARAGPFATGAAAHYRWFSGLRPSTREAGF